MAIDTSKLVSAAMLQDFIIGKDAEPLAAGIITMYKDNDHSTLKNWYYQTGVAGAYTYVALPNPMILSAAGTMQDVNGNDIIPFYYPWNETDEDISEPYFVTVYNANGQLQFTRSGFPFVPGGASPAPEPNFVTQENYIINNRFWRNIGTLTPTSSNNNLWTTQFNNTGTVAYWTLCPDQHDGFSMPDFNYIVPNGNLGSATETITFSTFSPGTTPQIINDVQPEFYIHHVCTADSGTYTKIYQFPISLHLATLANQPFSFTFQAIGSTVITISIYAFSGTNNTLSFTGASHSFTLSSSAWTKFTYNSTFPYNSSVTAPSTADDAYYLQISFNSGPIDFSFALPSIYIYDDFDSEVNGDDLFSFSTYDQIDTIISNPRTGDLRTSINQFYPFGWVPMNDGVIAQSNPMALANYARANSDCWPLYNLLWNLFSPYSVGGNQLVPIYTSAGSSTTFGSTAVADWQANKALALTLMMGNVLMGTVPTSALLQASSTYSGYSSTVTFSSSTVTTPGGQSVSTCWLITTSSANLLNWYLGAPFTIAASAGAVFPTGFAANTVFYLIPITSTTAIAATTFANALTANGSTGATVLTGSNSPSGTFTLQLFYSGSYAGEYAHKQLNQELAPHVHTYSKLSNVSGSGGYISPGGVPPVFTNTNTSSFPAVNTSVPFNVTQWGTFYNIYIKL